MLTAFVIGLIAAIVTIAVIKIPVMCGKWVKEYVSKKLKNREKHKVVIADTREVVDEHFKNKAANAKVSMADLERMCEEAPYAAAVVDEDGEISEYEGIKPAEYNKNFKARMKQNNGMVVLEV